MSEGRKKPVFPFRNAPFQSGSSSADSDTELSGEERSGLKELSVKRCVVGFVTWE